MSNKSGVAIDGYDAVSYFDGAPRMGSSEFEKEWNGLTWRFASAGNREKFASSPERYAPQFGGACAFATSLGREAHGSPRQWLVRDGKLYFALNPVARLLFRFLPGRAERAHANFGKR